MLSRAALRLKARGFATQSTSSFQIPVIDFQKFQGATSRHDKRSAADEIVSAFKDSGFIYLENHGIPSTAIQNTFEKSAAFFALDPDIKNKLQWATPESNRGYVIPGRERVTQSSDPQEIARLRAEAPDFKETMEIGRDWDSPYPNMWPTEKHAPLFKHTMLQFYKRCHDLHVQVMRSIALGLELNEDYFDYRIDKQCHNLRLLSYPAVKRELVQGNGKARAGAHSDYGTLTLLFQDSVGGLEVQNPHTKEYHPATPIPGTIVVNVGDLLARWSNDVLRSTLHRVVAPPAKKINETESISPARQSIAFFCNPNFDATISCLPTCVEDGQNPKYPTVVTENYIVGRLAATYK